MKFVTFRLFILAVVIFSFAGAFDVVGVCAGPNRPEKSSDAVSSDLITVDFNPERWQVKGSDVRFEEYLGRKTIFLKEGDAFLKDVDFENGVIEVDMAVPDGRGFAGVRFR